MQHRDVRVVELGEQARLAPESVEPLSVAGQLFRQDFDGDVTPELGVPGAVYLSG